MTDPHVPLSDEELSAALDGHADDTVIARLGTDADAQSRYRELAAARDLMAAQAVPPLPADLVDTLVARALAAADDPSTTADGRVVAPVAFARSARRTGPPMWAVAAVVVALVAVGVGLVWSGKDSGGDTGGDMAAGPTTPELDNSAEGPASESPGPDGAVPHGEVTQPTVQPEPPVPATLIDLGDFPTKGELRAFLADSFPQTGALTALDEMPTTATVKRCADQMATVMGGEGINNRPIRRAFVRIAGEAHLAFEYELLAPTDEAVSLITVVDPAACDPAFTFFRAP